MAVGGADKDPEWQQIGEEIVCPICGSIFDDPKTIPSCLHTFCRECLKESIKANRITETAICCPLCRAVLSDYQHLDYPTDFRMVRLIEIFNRRMGTGKVSVEPVRGCTKCEEELPVVGWCVQCQVSLCRDCKEVHSKWKEYREHTTVTIQEYLHHPKDFRIKKQPNDFNIEATNADEVVTGQGQSEDGATMKETSGEIMSSNISKDLSLEDTGNTFGSLDEDNTAIYPLCVTKCSFVANEIGMLSFAEGILVFIMNKEGNLWYVRIKHSGRYGYISSDHLEMCTSLYSYGWYFGVITREDAEIILMQPMCACGSFLVYDYKTRPGDYSLAVRDTNKVIHYWIRRLADGEFRVFLPQIFKNIPDLILYYSQEADELCTTLKSSQVILSQQKYVDGWEIINRNKVNLGRIIDSGEIHDVWDGEWNSTPVIIKTPRKEYVSIADFFDEIELMKKLRHDGIVRLLGVCTQENPILMITEYVDYSNSCGTEHMKCGNLLAYLRRKGSVLMKSQLIDMGIQISLAMDYLQEQNCVHRNLQATNIVVCCLSQQYTCKVTNFSLAKVIPEDGSYVKSAGKEGIPIKWTAPESLRTKRFTLKSDVWSFGIVLYELITCGTEPYYNKGLEEREILLENLNNGYRMPRPASCPVKLYEIMKKCWHEDADNRPTFCILQLELRKLLWFF